MAAPDALIISDPGMFVLAKKAWPDAEIHISTQANSTNYETWNFWWNLGADVYKRQGGMCAPAKGTISG